MCSQGRSEGTGRRHPWPRAYRPADEGRRGAPGAGALPCRRHDKITEADPRPASGHGVPGARRRAAATPPGRKATGSCAVGRGGGPDAAGGAGGRARRLGTGGRRRGHRTHGVDRHPRCTVRESGIDERDEPSMNATDDRYQTLEVEEVETGIVLVTLDRERTLNALTFAMFDELLAVATELDADPSVQTIVLTGAGRGFCSGLHLGDAETLATTDLGTNLRGRSTGLTASRASTPSTPRSSPRSTGRRPAPGSPSPSPPTSGSPPGRHASTPRSSASGSPAATAERRTSCRGSSGSDAPTSSS